MGATGLHAEEDGVVSWSVQDRSDDRSDFISGIPNTDITEKTIFVCRKKFAQIDIEVRAEGGLFQAVRGAFTEKPGIFIQLIAGRSKIDGIVEGLMASFLDDAWYLTIPLGNSDPEFWHEIARTNSLELVLGEHRERLVEPREGLEGIVAFAEGCIARQVPKP
jgi:hypothetical protein